MKVVFYSPVLNHHQAYVADEFYKLLGDNYCFVELSNNADTKGGIINYSQRPYLLRAWENESAKEKAFQYAQESEVCVFASVEALPFLNYRLGENKLSFLMSERWLKKGIVNLFSPNIMKMFLTYHIKGYSNKMLYGLCCSAYSSYDYKTLRMFKQKLFKWGYFVDSDSANNLTHKDKSIIRMMWCARFIPWKKPELAILLAARLREQGYSFQLDMFGVGPLLEKMKKMSIDLGLQDCVSFRGVKANEDIKNEMLDHDIFLFTSDKNEGWGVVLNESMGCGCCVVASDAIGSVPYLIKHMETGLIYQNDDLIDLVEKVKYLFDNPAEMRKIAKMGQQYVLSEWSPRNAVKNFMKLLEDLGTGNQTSIVSGPCSFAEIIKI